MPKMDSFIRIRVIGEEKEVWEDIAKENKFPSLSQFIRYVISEYIEHGFSRFVVGSESDNSKSKKEELKKLQAERKAIKEEREAIKEERGKYHKWINEILQERKRLTDIKVEDSIKGKILKWIDKFPSKLGSIDIAEIIGKSESEALDILNKMEDRVLIKLNKNFKYRVINNQDN
ncbi:MAG: hypothetical protein ACTSV5_13400 [Promethearchaeota archaeon]